MNNIPMNNIPIDNIRSAGHIVATHCCVCSHKLTDALSVQKGIGPICSGKYYGDETLPTEEQVKAACGTLAVSDLPDDIIDEVLKQADAGHGRKACNMLVYYASAHYNDKAVVLQIATIVADFGYSELAKRLVDDRTKVKLSRNSLKIVVGTSKNWRFFQKLRSISGCQEEPKQGRKFFWSVPDTQENQAKVECLLGLFYGREKASVDAGFMGMTVNGVTTIRHRSWYDWTKLITKTAPQPSRPVVHMVDLGDKVEFWSPYNVRWLYAMKDQVPYRQRKWTGSCWVFTKKVKAMVKDLAFQYYQVTL